MWTIEVVRIGRKTLRRRFGHASIEKMTLQAGRDGLLKRISGWAVWATLVDCALFIWSWGDDTVRLTRHQAVWPTLYAMYWITGVLGILFAIWGFLALTRGGPTQIRRATACVLFSMVPGCVALMTVLSTLKV